MSYKTNAYVNSFGIFLSLTLYLSPHQLFSIFILTYQEFITVTQEVKA